MIWRNSVQHYMTDTYCLDYMGHNILYLPQQIEVGGSMGAVYILYLGRLADWQRRREVDRQ